MPHSTPHSPLLSDTSSFDYVSSVSPSLTFSESEDEIVWTVSRREASRISLSDSDVTDGSSYSSDDDLVLISRNKPIASPNAEGSSSVTASDIAKTLVKGMESLKVKGDNGEAERKRERRRAAAKRRRNRRKEARKSQSTSGANSDSGFTSTVPSPDSESERGSVREVTNSGFGARSVIDDSSERLSVADEEGLSKYDEASSFISSFLSNPQIKNNAGYRLTLLQSLIIELGLASTQLPTTLTSAKTYLKSNAFLNVREYLAVRDQGPEALRKLLHPSKSSLVRDIRKNKNPASLKWVKEHGLQVLLVSRIR